MLIYEKAPLFSERADVGSELKPDEFMPALHCTRQYPSPSLNLFKMQGLPLKNFFASHNPDSSMLNA
jgi:hypothetical protein